MTSPLEITGGGRRPRGVAAGHRCLVEEMGPGASELRKDVGQPKRDGFKQQTKSQAFSPRGAGGFASKNGEL